MKAFKLSGNSTTGQVPYLEIEGLKLVQTLAISRFLARRYGLCGDRSESTLVKIDMVAETVQDTRNMMYQVMFTRKPERRERRVREFWETTAPNYGRILERFLAQNQSNSGYFVGDRLTWADLAAYDGWAELGFLNPKATAPFKRLAAHCQRIEAVPAIARWIAKRPKTAW